MYVQAPPVKMERVGKRFFGVWGPGGVLRRARDSGMCLGLESA